MTIYESFGLSPLINAAGTKTRLGGVRMADEVQDAMRAAADYSVDLAELQGVASAVIAELTGAEAGYITSGAAAGLTLSAAASLTGTDPSRIDRLPDTREMPNQIVIARTHRNSYDHAWRAAGAHLVEVGLNDTGVGSGMRTLDSWELEAAINERTVALAFVATRTNVRTLEMFVRVAHAHDLPVLVDAAAQLPPAANLRIFIEEGADLVAFSGGKAVGGPQSTGFLAGRKHLIQAVLLNHLDFDIDFSLWSPPPSLFADEELRCLPRHGIGRGFKVSKENAIGLLTALRRFTSTRWQDDAMTKKCMAEDICLQIPSDCGIVPTLVEAHGIPRVELQFTSDSAAITLYRSLLTGQPAIALDPSKASTGRLVIDTIGLSQDEGHIVVREILRNLGRLPGEGLR